LELISAQEDNQKFIETHRTGSKDQIPPPPQFQHYRIEKYPEATFLININALFALLIQCCIHFRDSSGENLSGRLHKSTSEHSLASDQDAEKVHLLVDGLVVFPPTLTFISILVLQQR